jgi:hypothetical protein
MDSQNEEFDRAAAHYAFLARQPGWIDYARHQVDELENDKSGIYSGLKDEVRKRLEQAKAEKMRGVPGAIHPAKAHASGLQP